MRRAGLSLAAVLLVGVLLVLPSNAPTVALAGVDSVETPSASVEAGTTAGKNMDIGLLIVVDRLELTSAQMRQVRDIVAGLVEQAQGLEGERATFAQDLLRFAGTREELDKLVAAFKAQMKEKASSLRDAAQAGIDQLKDTLTIRQGEILRHALPGRIGQLGSLLGTAPGSAKTGQVQTESSTQGKRLQQFLETHPRAKALLDSLGAVQAGTQGQGSATPLSAGQEKLQNLLARRPQLKALLDSLSAAQSQDEAQPSSSLQEQTPSVSSTTPDSLDGQLLARRGAGQKVLSRLEEILQILDFKLQHAS